ncbi:nitroreductase [candidate division KSB1 bacterium]|nr:MAG: nitroreductase [candidate division KSB1 bacterium]
MDVFEAIKFRRSIRSYQPKEIPKKSLERIIDAFRFAPSANNEQPWKLIIVKNEELKKDLAKACNQQWFIAEAPCILVACGLPNFSKIGGYSSSLMVDVGIAFTCMMLAAYEEGLGTCYIGAFSEYDVKKILNIPDAVRVVGLTPLGYPQKQIKELGLRKSVKDVVYHEKYGEQ